MLAQFLHDAGRALARCAAMHQALRKALGGQPAFFFQRVQHRFDLVRVVGIGGKLAGEFFARMFTPRQIPHGAHLQRRPLAFGLAIGRCGAFDRVRSCF
ncbi:hypothetical protein D3C78_1771400 [compost metagenome]